MPCRVTAKRRHKKVKKRPLFAFCAALPTEQENTQPALQTLLTNGKIHIVQLLSQQSFHLSVHLLPYKRKPKSTLTAYEKEPHSDVLDRPVIGMWLFRFLIVCTAVFLVMLYARLSFVNFSKHPSVFPFMLRSMSQRPPARYTAVLPRFLRVHTVPARHPAGPLPDGTILQTRSWSSGRF